MIDESEVNFHEEPTDYDIWLDQMTEHKNSNWSVKVNDRARILLINDANPCLVLEIWKQTGLVYGKLLGKKDLVGKIKSKPNWEHDFGSYQEALHAIYTKIECYKLSQEFNLIKEEFENKNPEFIWNEAL